MSHVAHIDGLTTSELVGIISNSRLSGVATIVNGWKTGRIVFVWGRIVHARADGLQELGESLVSKNLISNKDLAEAVKAQHGNFKGRPLGTLLTALGFCDSETIEEVIVDQIKKAFREIMSWESAMIHFKLDDQGCAPLMVNVALDTQALLLEAAQRDDESNKLHSEEQVPEPNNAPVEQADLVPK